MFLFFFDQLIQLVPLFVGVVCFVLHWSTRDAIGLSLLGCVSFVEVSPAAGAGCDSLKFESAGGQVK